MQSGLFVSLHSVYILSERQIFYRLGNGARHHFSQMVWHFSPKKYNPIYIIRNIHFRSSLIFFGEAPIYFIWFCFFRARERRHKLRFAVTSYWGGKRGNVPLMDLRWFPGLYKSLFRALREFINLNQSPALSRDQYFWFWEFHLRKFANSVKLETFSWDEIIKGKKSHRRLYLKPSSNDSEIKSSCKIT
jgi:hypothetical protein